jgi:hypothetical protein
MSDGREFHGRGTAPAHPGRHRRGTAAGWTPPVPQYPPVRHHADDTAPIDVPAAGFLPLPQPGTPALPQPRDRWSAQTLFPAARGSLPVDGEVRDGPDFGEPDVDDPVAMPDTESWAEQAARRTRVSLTTPKPRTEDLDDDDVCVYAAPPIDGLGGFTIGSVPASVTPPKTWRKAAWFATCASGAVVVGMLFAGSYLVGHPAMDQAVQGAWPGYQGAPAVIDPTGGHQQPTSRPDRSAASPDSSRRPDDATETSSGGGAGPVDGANPPPPVGSTPAPATTDVTPPSEPPRKPPVAAAQRETQAKAPWWYSFPPDAQTLGDNSEKFFNTVTTDPATASSVTTGQLHDQGPQALAQRYAGIAYFEVKKVSIDQQRGVTVNTVEITHTDGTRTTELRTLTFGDGDKITSDGQ